MILGITASSINKVTAYTINNATDDTNEFSVVTQVTYGYSLEAKPDGTKFYLADGTAISGYSYTAGDVSTAGYDSPDKALGGAITRGFIIADSGTRAYSSDTGERQDQYALSTAYLLSSMGTSIANHVMTDQVANIDDIHISPDGTKYYLLAEETVWQYTLSTAWDITSETYASKNLVATSQLTTGTGMDMSPDGTKLILLDVGGIVYQYTLNTAYDISTATYDTGVTLDASAKDTAMWGVKWTKNGTKILLSGYTNDKVYQYSVN